MGVREEREPRVTLSTRKLIIIISAVVSLSPLF